MDVSVLVWICVSECGAYQCLCVCAHILLMCFLPQFVYVLVIVLCLEATAAALAYFNIGQVR